MRGPAFRWRLPAPRWTLRRMTRPEAVMLPVSAGNQDLQIVLGLQWHTILGTDLHARARRKARAAGATHWVHAGGRAESVGMAWLPRRASVMGARRTAAHAGAQLFARGMPAGIYVLGWRLDDGRYWLAMARDGQVMGNGDAILPTRTAALEALHRAQARFGNGLRCLGAAAELLPEAADDDRLRQGAIDPAGLAAAATAASLLQPARAAVYRLPIPVVGLLLAALAGTATQIWWRSQAGPGSAPAELEATLDRAGPVQAEPGARGPQAAAEQPTGPRRVTARGVQQLWMALGELPAVQSGWALQRMQCSLSGAAWNCAAGYRRLSPHALARSFAQSVPAHWRLNWDELDSVQAGFAVAADVSASVVAASAMAGPGLMPSADVLQPLRPLLRRVEVGRPATLPLAASPDDPGDPAPPRGVLIQRPVTLEGPWRSIVLAAPALAAGIAWQRVAIEVRPGAHAGLTASMFMASLHGVSYASHVEDAARQ